MKLLKIMVLLLVVVNLKAQDLSVKINLSKNVKTIGEVLAEIKRETGINFSYDSKKITTDQSINLSKTKGSVEEVLNATFFNTGISYTIAGKTVLLKKTGKYKSEKRESKSDIKELNGKLIDKKTGEPLAFATVRFKGTSKGVVSNEEGNFNLKLDEDTSNEILLVSFIGYYNKEVSINEFGKTRLTIELEENVVSLSEVEVTPKEPLEIIKDALKKIAANYRTEKYAYNAYYRELVKVDTSFVRFADAATYINNAGYTKAFPKEPAPAFVSESGMLPFFDDVNYSASNKHIKIIESRASDNLQKLKLKFFNSAFETFGLSNGTVKLLKLDYMEIPMEFLDSKKWKLYSYELEDYTFYNNKQAYVISFTPKSKGNRKAFIEGKLYIDIESSAVIGYDFEITEKYQKKLYKKPSLTILQDVPKKLRDQLGNQSRVKRKMGDYHHKVSVQFQEFEGKWYLSQVKKTSFYRNSGNVMEDMFFEVNHELIVNEIFTENLEEVPRKERFRGFLFDYPLEYNPEFWTSYNSVLPTGVFGKALADLQKGKTLEEQFKSRVTKDTTLTPPIAKKVAVSTKIHGTTLTDNYQWLQDLGDEDTQKYIEEENAYTKNYMIPLKKLRRNLYAEMVDRVKKNDESVPVKIDEYYYYARFVDSLDYPIYARKYKNLNAEEEIIQDVNKLAEGKDYYSLYPDSPSPDHSLMPFYENLDGGFENILRFKNLKENNFILDSLKDVFSMVWFESGDAFLYTKQEEKTLRSNQVYLHRLGTPQESDELIYEEKDTTFSVDLGKSKSKKYIFIYAESKNENEVYVLDANDVNQKMRVFLPREEGHHYSITHNNATFFIASNLNAPNFQLFTVPENDWSKKNWRIAVPQQEETLITSFQIFDNHVILREKRNAQSYLRIVELETGKTNTLKFGNQPHVVSLGSNPDPSSKSFVFEYEDPITPPIVYRYNFENGDKTIVKTSKVQGPYDMKEYKMERIFATAHDGEQIPITLIYKKGAQKPTVTKLGREKIIGERKLYLTSYGAYGVSSEPYFSYARLSLIDRRVIYAIAHIRGGRDKGEVWYQDGKLLNKKNSFKDFISAAEHLIEEDYIEKGNIAISGGSAGGLLVGAVVNERPELFKAAVLNVPFLDVVNTMMNDELPLTTGEYKEWGNPEDKTYFDYMLSYAPYENVKKQDYPNMLFTCAINDDNVPYWETAKMVAKLRDYKTDSNEIILNIDTTGGHGGGSRRFDGFFEIASEYAFILDLWNKK